MTNEEKQAGGGQWKTKEGKKQTGKGREGGKGGKETQHNTHRHTSTHTREKLEGVLVQSVVGKKANKKNTMREAERTSTRHRRAMKRGKERGKEEETDALLALRKDSLTEVTAAKDRAHEGAMAHASTPLWRKKNMGTVSAFSFSFFLFLFVFFSSFSCTQNLPQVGEYDPSILVLRACKMSDLMLLHQHAWRKEQAAHAPTNYHSPRPPRSHSGGKAEACRTAARQGGVNIRNTSS